MSEYIHKVYVETPGGVGTTYDVKDSNLTEKVTDLKSAIDKLDNDFIEHEQYLLLSEWIANSRYSANSTNYGADTNYRRYAPIELKAGKYYYYAIHPYFTNLKFEDETVTNLTSYSGTTQTVNNRDGYFVLSEKATIYISTNQMTNSMLSMYEQNPNVYVEGIYYRKLKEDIMPFTLSDLTASDVQIDNVLLSVLEDVPTNNFVVYSNGKLVQSSPSSGNAGWKLPVDVSKLKNNLVELDFDIEAVTGTGRLYCIGKTVTGTDKFIMQANLTTAGKHKYVFDLNSFVVYNDFDLSKPVYLAVYNQTNDFTCTYTLINSYSIITELDTGMNLNDNLNAMYINVEYAKNGVNSIINSKKLIAPDGTSYFLQVSNSGELHAVESVPAKAVFIGNSLLLGNGTFGMCATDNENDYYYYVTEAIIAQKSNATFQKQHGSSFEVAETLTAATTWINTYIAPLMGNDVGLVVIQLGDNVNNATRVNVFKDSCVALLRYIRENSPNANVIWVGEWYSTTEKQSIIADACAKTGSTFVDISDLYNTANMGHLGDVIHKTTETTTTYTVDSYTDDATNNILSVVFSVSGTQYTSDLPYTSYTASDTTLTVTSYYTLVNNTGLSSHPGNTGMLKIAERICNAIGL